jgi:hypothetical protein
MGTFCEHQVSPVLETVLAHLKGVRSASRGWVACCPAHADRHPSLSISVGDQGQVLLKCFAHCPLERIVEAMGLTVEELFPNASSQAFAHQEAPSITQRGDGRRSPLSTVDLAWDKQLPWKFLFHLGVMDQPGGGVEIPYHLPDGKLAPRHRLRTALVAKEGSRWSRGEGKIVPYGLERLEEARKAGYLVIAEGESDCWTLWYHHIPALGVPGAALVNTLEADYLTGIDKVYIIQEPDAAGTRFVKGIERRLAGWKWTGKAYVVTLPGAKDPNALHQHDHKAFKAAFQQALEQAEPLFMPQRASLPPGTDGKPSPISLQALLAKVLPPVRWAVPDILPEGLTLLAGKPKQGKSWLALALALAIALGGLALGALPVTQAAVLYLALEDNERRLQSRARQLLASMSHVPCGIEFALHWPRLGEGGLLYLEEYLQAHPQVRLVVIDTWVKFAPRGQSSQRSQYENDYDALTPLKELADKYQVSILVIHHLRKTCAVDVLDEITGSTGVSGAVDGMLILKRERGQQEASLFVTGRDIEQEQQLALTFDPESALWTLVGDAEEYRRSKERQEILHLLTEQGPDGMTPRQVAEALDKNYHTTRSLLRKMEAAGDILQCNHQYVVLSDTTSRHHCQSPVASDRQVDTVEQVREDTSSHLDDAEHADTAGHSRLTAPSAACETPAGGSAKSARQASSDVPHPQGWEDIQQCEDQGCGDASNSPPGLQCDQRNERHHVECFPPEETCQCQATVPAPVSLTHPAEEVSAALLSKHHCPRHPHARWVRFDPSGQAWCNKLDCWDCYRLMKIGEALEYSCLTDVGGHMVIAQGMEAWSAFVVTQRVFLVVVATEQAIALCKSQRIEVPDLSDEAQRLVEVDPRPP